MNPETIKARFVRLTGQKKGGIELELEDGNRRIMSIVYITPEGCARARELSIMKENGVPADPGSTPKPAPEPATAPEPVPAPKSEFESWTANNGKTIHARFISLNGDQITLEMAHGKSYTMPLERLNEANQERAKALQTAQPK